MSFINSLGRSCQKKKKKKKHNSLAGRYFTRIRTSYLFKTMLWTFLFEQLKLSSELQFSRKKKKKAENRESHSGAWLLQINFSFPSQEELTTSMFLVNDKKRSRE